VPGAEGGVGVRHEYEVSKSGRSVLGWRLCGVVVAEGG
jgi:hypothetical protein